MRELLQRTKVKYIYPFLSKTISRVSLSIKNSTPETQFDPPFFILGTGRNGSTLLSCLLNNHPDLFVPSEHYAFPKGLVFWNFSRLLGWENFVSSFIDNLEEKQVAWQLDWTAMKSKYKTINKKDRNLRFLIDGLYREEAKIHKQTFKYWGDKTPLNTDHLNLIMSAFPDAKFIYLVRDPRAVINSYIHYPKHLKSLNFWMWKWEKRNKQWQELSRKIPERTLMLRYEDLVLETEKVLRDICEFLQVDASLEMQHGFNQHMKMLGIEKSFNHENLNQKISGEHIGRWKDELSPMAIKKIEKRLAVNMKKLAYL